MENDVVAMKAGFSELRGEMKTELSELRGEMRSGFSDWGKRHERDFRILFGALITFALGLTGLLAKGFGWIH